MDKLKTLQTDLKTAQDALTALQDELPQFHTLLTDNEGDAQRLKSERASLDAQAQARGRVQIAREMLEQHRSDIATARAEVTRLEGALQHETYLLNLTELAMSATARRKTLNKLLVEASSALERHIAKIYKEWGALSSDRQTFMNQARETSRFFALTGVPGGMRDETEQQESKKAHALLETLEARGVDTVAILTPHDGRRLSMMDKYGDGIKAPERFGGFVMGALASELNQNQEVLRAELRLKDRERLEAANKRGRL